MRRKWTRCDCDLRLLLTVLVLDQLVALVHDRDQLLQQERLPLLVGI